MHPSMLAAYDKSYIIWKKYWQIGLIKLTIEGARARTEACMKFRVGRHIPYSLYVTGSVSKSQEVKITVPRTAQHRTDRDLRKKFKFDKKYFCDSWNRRCNFEIKEVKVKVIRHTLCCKILVICGKACRSSGRNLRVSHWPRPLGQSNLIIFLVHGQVTHYFRSVCLFVCLFVCAEFFSAVFGLISIKLGHMLYVWDCCVP